MGYALVQAQRWLEKHGGEIPREAQEFIKLSRNAARVRSYAIRATVVASVCLALWWFWLSTPIVTFFYWVNHVHGMDDAQLPATFKECTDCPEMVVVQPGEFSMGSPESKGNHDEHPNEHPQHQVTIARPFAVAKSPVTLGQWMACEKKGVPRSKSFSDLRNCPDGRGFWNYDMVITHVTWSEARDYVRWLSAITGKHYRLLSEAEWEYAARLQAFKPKRYWEWVRDCYHNNYEGAPKDKGPWIDKGKDGLDKCQDQVARGGGDPERNLVARTKLERGSQTNEITFRVGRSLTEKSTGGFWGWDWIWWQLLVLLPGVLFGAAGWGVWYLIKWITSLFRSGKRA
jgi:formylglycine-generating enzyme required for sulfatase activity